MFKEKEKENQHLWAVWARKDIFIVIVVFKLKATIGDEHHYLHFIDAEREPQTKEITKGAGTYLELFHFPH